MKEFKTVLKDKFSYDVSEIGTYVDEQSDDIYQEFLHSSGLTSRINVMENVKDGEKIKLLNVEFNLQAADGCELEDDGTVTFTDKTMRTERVGVQFSLCNENLNGTWAQMLNVIGAQRQDEEMPLEDVITAFVIKSAKKKNQDLMFLGDTDSLDENLAFYDGFLKLWDNDNDMVEAPREGSATIDKTNGWDNAMSVYEAIPDEIFDNEVPVEIITGRKEARAILRQIWDDKDYNGKVDFTNENGELSFMLPTADVMIRTYPQLNKKNGMWATPYQLMFFGTDQESDLDGYFVKYLDESEKLRFGMKWRSGVNYVLSKFFVKLSGEFS